MKRYLYQGFKIKYSIVINSKTNRYPWYFNNLYVEKILSGEIKYWGLIYILILIFTQVWKNHVLSIILNVYYLLQMCLSMKCTLKIRLRNLICLWLRGLFLRPTDRHHEIKKRHRCLKITGGCYAHVLHSNSHQLRSSSSEHFRLYSPLCFSFDFFFLSNFIT